MRSAGVLVFLICASVVAAPAPLPRPARVESNKEDLKRMQGTWLRLTCTGGTIPAVPRPINDTVEITGDRISYGSGSTPWILTLGTANGKKTFDIMRQPDNGAPGQVWLGLYELKGDTLRVCFTPSSTRPNDIQPSKKGEHLQTFQRKKP